MQLEECYVYISAGVGNAALNTLTTEHSHSNLSKGQKEPLAKRKDKLTHARGPSGVRHAAPNPQGFGHVSPPLDVQTTLLRCLH